MNLNKLPTLQQLMALFSGCNDGSGDHVLWVDKSGNVHLTCLPSSVGPLQFEQNTPSMQLRYETFLCGNGYVGAGASADKDFMDRIYKSLVTEWSNTTISSVVDYIDIY